MDIYIGKKGLVFGPYYLDEVRKRMDEARLDGSELAWHEGLEGWTDVKMVVNGVASKESRPAQGQAVVETAPLDEKTRDQVRQIKELVADDDPDAAWQLICSLNNSRIYEELLKDCPVDKDASVSVPDYLNKNGDLFIKLLVNLPESARVKPELTQLTVLNLGGNRITDVSALAGLTQLERLDLAGNQITDVGALAGLTQLTVLNLGGNRITDVGALAGLTQLTELNLNATEITDASALAGLTRLTSLSLWFNPNLTEAAIDELQKALPDCKIYHNAKK